MTPRQSAGLTRPLNLRVSPEDWERWQAAAAAEGYSTTSEWLRRTLNAHAAEVLEEKPKRRK